MSPTPSPASGAQRGYFVIADISGYTGYLANNELAHAQGILSEITNLLIEELSAPFRFVELEGDAVFVFAPEVAVEDSERLIDIVESCYAAFRLLQEQMVTNTTCTCRACRAIKELDLKCVAHFGEYIPQQTPTGTKLVGTDVILVHRLLKNSVIERTAIKAYAFLTSPFVERATVTQSGLGAPMHEETYAELGTIEGRVLDLASSLERHTGAEKHFVSETDADFVLEKELPAPPSAAWGYFVDAGRRMRWQLDTTSVESEQGPDGRTGVGATTYCDHGSYRLNHRIADWRPFDYLTMNTTSEGRSPAKPPSGLATFAFEDLGDGTCRVAMRLRAHDRGLATRLLFSTLGWLIRRHWSGHFRELERVMREDFEAADRAAPRAVIAGADELSV